MKIEIYVQARMGSTRLPGKVMKQVVGKPLLSHLIDRLKRVKEADALVILTTALPADDVIVDLCKQEGVLCYRGSDEDVLDRYYQVAAERRPDAVVRVTGDCPLIDPEIVDQVIRVYRDSYPKYDYISNTLQLTYPRGFDTEVFSFHALEQAYQAATKNAEREHVTLYLYRNPHLFKLHNVASALPLAHYRLTVDTPEDFKLIQLIFEDLYPRVPNFILNDVIALLQQHPDWAKMNQHIKQKES